MPTPPDSDERYLRLILDALAVCRNYKPKFGKGGKAGFALDEFRQLYGADPFYTWFGLDSPLVYAAHKAAGGITSVYRQIGIACERLVRQLFQDTLGLTPADTGWTYQVRGTRGRKRTLSLDARIPLDAITDHSRSQAVRDWMTAAAREARGGTRAATNLARAVFEVRQGYKSADSKRQNADIGNAASAYAHSYLPVVFLFSSQIDTAIEERYARAQWTILRGSLQGDSVTSSYVFSTQVLAYDLAGFFSRNSQTIRTQVEGIIEELLR
jgi:hypothetical protein